MSSLFIPGMNKPERCSMCPAYHLIEVPKAWLDPDPTFKVKPFCALTQEDIEDIRNVNRNCPLVEIQTPHGRLIDADALSRAMYHEAFETDSDWQRWDSGLWIRYKMFEIEIDKTPTIIESEE